ncbi:MAG: PA14 domain-containing protein, partial [bacterium]
GGNVPNDYFGVIWTGYFRVAQAGQYTFRTYSDDGVRLYINGNRVIDDWVDHAPAERVSNAINLTIGWHSVRLEFYENGGGAVCQLYWRPPGQNDWSLLPGVTSVPWMTINPTGGNINAQGQVNINVQMPTRGLRENQEYRTTIVLQSNSRSTPVINIPVLLRVLRWQPGEVVVRPAFSYAVVDSGGRSQRQIVLRNVGQGNYEFRIRFVGPIVGWVNASPDTAVIGPGRQLTVTLSYTAGRRNPGVYNLTMILRGNNPSQPETNIPITLVVARPLGQAYGVVRRLDNDQPVNDALVLITGTGIGTYTNERGEYRLEQVPVGRHTITVISNLHPAVSDTFEVRQGEETEVNFALRYSSLVVSPGEVDEWLPPDEETEVRLRLENRGNGVLRWGLRREVSGGEIEPLSLRGLFWAQ